MAKDDSPKYAYLDQMSTEKLEELLRTSIHFSDEAEDEDCINAILEVIIKREKEHPTGRLTDIDKAWSDFQTHFNTPEGEGLSLFAEDWEELVPAPPPPPASRPHPGRRRFRHTLIAAALIAVLVVFALPAALGYQSLFKMIGVWSDEQFWFERVEVTPTPVPGSTAAAPEISAAPEASASNAPEAEYQSLQEALDDYGVTEHVVPTWIPDGYVLNSISVREFPTSGRTTFSAYYENIEGEGISIGIRMYSQLGGSTFEKDDAPIRLYAAGGVNHYIFDNCGYMTATWDVGNLVCSITVSSDETQLENLINSVYER